MLEYKIVERDADHKAEEGLNQAVRDGWELLEFKMRRFGNGSYYVFLLRRGGSG